MYSVIAIVYNNDKRYDVYIMNFLRFSTLIPIIKVKITNKTKFATALNAS